VVEAARQRFRPIIMTSMAFSLGVLPLVLSSGAGSAGRNAIGSGVLGGTLSATILGVIFVPVFYVMVRTSQQEYQLAIPGDRRLEANSAASTRLRAFIFFINSVM
jgi:Cu/Ag efflux pump CusA